MILRRCCSYLLRNVQHFRPNITNIKITTTHFNDSPTRFKSTNSSEQDEHQPKNDETDRQLKLIHLEISNLRESGGRAPNPELLKKHQWEELLSLKTKSARHRLYSFLFLIEKKTENEMIKRQAKREAYLEFKENKALEGPKTSGHIDYSLGNTRFMLVVRDATINMWRNNRLTRAMQFGDKLIFDCSYDQHMTAREAKNASKQLMTCFAENRLHKEPFDLYFCNANFDGNTMKTLERYIPTLRNAEFPLNLHEGSYLDLFSKKNLVYLTPHCKNDLVEYDPDSIYIIGAMVDKMNQEPLSLGKAKQLGLRMARLPLDRYLKWNSGSGKSLTLNQMTQIMLDLKTTRNWNHALRHVPNRKINNEDAPSVRRKNVRKWTANVNTNTFAFDFSEKNGESMSTADKFKKKLR